MAEEDITNPSTITSEDFDALRILLHRVRGLSVVSTSSPVQASTSADEQLDISL
jgi:hypothetical protein